MAQQASTTSDPLSEDDITRIDEAVRMVQDDRCPRRRCGRQLYRRYVQRGEVLLCMEDGFNITLAERRAALTLFMPVLITRLQVHENGHHLR